LREVFSRALAATRTNLGKTASHLRNWIDNNTFVGLIGVVLCACAQGRVRQMHDAQFKDQAHLKPGDLTAHAGEIGLEKPAFSKYTEDSSKAEAV